MITYRTAYVYVRNTFAGILKETDGGYSFKYDEACLNSAKASPVSLTLPLQSQVYTSKILFPFFDGLIPEGWLFKVITEKHNVQSSDRFDVLLVACKDGVGNVSVREVKE